MFVALCLACVILIGYAIASDELFMAARALLPVAACMVIVPRQRSTIVATMAWLLRLTTDFAAVEYRIKFAIDCLDGSFYAAVCLMHFPLAILADSHCYSLPLPLFSCGISLPLLSVSRPAFA